MALEWHRDGYTVTTDVAALDVRAIHAYLTQSYWAGGVPFETVERSLEHSLNFGLLEAGAQVGFARVVTDYATFAYLADVYVLVAHRGRGLTKRTMEDIHGHPELQGLRRWLLATRDAHALYAKHGFTALAAPERLMERHDPRVYGEKPERGAP
jgi:GNAT superfamily N-acetyltransferase